MIKYLIEKEFKQMLRNPAIPKLILIFPIITMVIIPWAANQEVRKISFSVVDHDRSTYSDRLIRKIASTQYFDLEEVTQSHDEAMNSIKDGRTDVILEIPHNFEREWVREGTAKVMVSANSVDGIKGSIGTSYMVSILRDFSDEISAEWGTVRGTSVVRQSMLNMFNPHLDYKVFMVPALMVMLLTLVCGFLPAFNIVGEKEAGTIEQINVSPVSKFSFIMGKLLPYWAIGLLIFTVCIGIAIPLYGIRPVGSLWIIYFFAALFILQVSGFGLVISNYSSTMQQAMFLMFFFMIIFILMSGLYTPVNSMPRWAQTIAIFNPLKYFIEAMRMVYLKGSGIADLGRQFLALSLFAMFSNSWAILSYKKSK